jgi:uncharacterized membrane protein YdjX (TVP38/TMEM64 family)
MSGLPTPELTLSRRPVRKLIVLAVVLLAAVVGYWQSGDALSLESLAGRESQLRDYQREHPGLMLGLAFVIYVAVTGLSLPGAAAMTLVYGWYFGFASALVLVSFASTSGATLAFLLSRYLLRDEIQSRFGDKLASFNENLDREGALYLFTLRLIPAVPFFVINVVMGLTAMKTRTFWWVSQLGMLAGTAVYVYAGSTVPSLRVLAERGAGGIVSLPTLLAFIALGLFPLMAKRLLRLARSRQRADASTSVSP